MIKRLKDLLNVWDHTRQGGYREDVPAAVPSAVHAVIAMARRIAHDAAREWRCHTCGTVGDAPCARPGHTSKERWAVSGTGCRESHTWAVDVAEDPRGAVVLNGVRRAAQHLAVAGAVLDTKRDDRERVAVEEHQRALEALNRGLEALRLLVSDAQER